jgi:hypothetical protein
VIFCNSLGGLLDIKQDFGCGIPNVIFVVSARGHGGKYDAIHAEWLLGLGSGVNEERVNHLVEQC